MSVKTYFPERGDIIHFNASPAAGHEMDGPHFAINLSPQAYTRKTGLAIVLIGTSKKKPKDHPRFGFIVSIPPGLIPPTADNPTGEGYVLCDCVRQIDWRERNVAFVSKAPTALVEDAIDFLLAAIEEPKE